MVEIDEVALEETIAQEVGILISHLVGEEDIFLILLAFFLKRLLLQKRVLYFLQNRDLDTYTSYDLEGIMNVP